MTHGPKPQLISGGNRVVRSKKRDTAYDTKTKPMPIDRGANRPVAGPTPKVHGRAQRAANAKTEAERIELVSTLGKAFDAALGDRAALLLVAAQAEAAELFDLARRYRREAG